MERPNNGTQLTRRAGAVCIALTVAFALLSMLILFYQTVRHKQYSEKVLNQVTQEAKISADRGEIYDRNGILLATNITTYRLLVDPAVIDRTSQADGVNYREVIAKGLSEIPELEIEYDFIMEQMQYTKYRDRTLQRHVMEDIADKVREFLKTAGIDRKGFVFLQATSKRYYP